MDSIRCTRKPVSLCDVELDLWTDSSPKQGRSRCQSNLGSSKLAYSAYLVVLWSPTNHPTTSTDIASRLSTKSSEYGVKVVHV